MRRALMLVLAAALLGAGVLVAPSAADCAGGPCNLTDYDRDEIRDWADNCPLVSNVSQKDLDGDSLPAADAGTPPDPVGGTTGPLRLYPYTPVYTGKPLDTDMP